jgi:hypothetical protein
MINQIKTFKRNALALELTGAFTNDDVQLLKQLFEEKLNDGSEHVNLLFKVKDMTQFKHADLKALLTGEAWGMSHFYKIGRCAVVAHSDFIKAAVEIESKPLHWISNALDEKYFDETQLEEALLFVNPD